ncbi:probable inactive leucine-rich repeat receptor-like protein kinase At3g03770 isoform X2 [Mercurialis annua]|uniref:probable inactive leucine-rich repeat receptor-like protein kinase At3g03770 isoform X2 n=1 Tax=Mercurialis annua TaxID=3986 RepID=UPI0024ACAF54|nr:probable inactive leucine-rich repeat receptor-like protein kinase At3g03770 isoform X2 [Mercurialis annua]
MRTAIEKWKMGPDRYRRLFATFSIKAKQLAECTDGFSPQNFIGNFQFGEVYRGTFQGKDVIVKIWKDENSLYTVKPGDNEERYRKYFKENDLHPNMAKFYAHCDDGGYRAIIYHLQPKAIDTLHNLIEKDTFTWPQRIKVALGFASLLEFMHAPHPKYLPYLIRNIDAAHILVDEDYEPILFDVSMISGGILTDKRNIWYQYVDGCYGYIDPLCARPGKWSDKCDVFSYGVLLLALIGKRVSKYNAESPPISGSSQNSVIDFGKRNCALLHQSLALGSDFYSTDATEITNLAKKCVQSDPQRRPTMKKIMRCLQNLQIVQHNASTWEICKLLNGDKAILTGYHYSDSTVKDRRLLTWNSGHVSQFNRGSDYCRAGKNTLEEDYDTLEVFSYKELSMFTNGFNEQNFIGKFQFGRVFRGMIQEKKVMVKIWEPSNEIYLASQHGNKGRLRDEIALLRDARFSSHPNMVKLIGYCHEEEKLGAVYDLDPHQTLYNLSPKDDLTWLQRIKIAYEFACLLEFLHARNLPYMPFLVRNLDANHIIVDKDYSPKLFDFGMSIGGIILDARIDRNRFLFGCYGYMDADALLDGGIWYTFSDVYAYGCVLLGLISKKVYTEEDVKNGSVYVSDSAIAYYDEEKSKARFNQARFSLVERKLSEDGDHFARDGAELTRLALQCVALDLFERPSMKQVVKRLLNLQVVRKHAKELGIRQVGKKN